jgi:hypothetical protein
MKRAFVFTRVPTALPTDAALVWGLRFLEETRATDSSPRAGEWPSLLNTAAGSRPDWNCFALCLAAEGLATVALTNALPESLRHRARAMHGRALTAISRYRADTSTGAFRFWRREDHARPGPDLDDTALAQHVLLGAQPAEQLQPRDALALFGPYRATTGCALHSASCWAQAYPGAFAVWMSAGSAIVDACAAANVVRFLLQIGARDVPGYRASLAMLGDLLTNSAAPAQYSPYYPSEAFLLWRCATIGPPAGVVLSADEVTVTRAVDARLSAWPGIAATSALDMIVRSAAMQASGRQVADTTITRILRAQQSDGGWPAGAICRSLDGRMYWTSRAVTTALALSVLAASQSRAGVAERQVAAPC